VIAARRLVVNWSLGGEKICRVYSLFCILIIIIVIIISTSIISISFVVLINCFTSTHEFPFCPFLLPIPLGIRGGVSERLSSA